MLIVCCNKWGDNSDAEPQVPKKWHEHMLAQKVKWHYGFLGKLCDQHPGLFALPKILKLKNKLASESLPGRTG